MSPKRNDRVAPPPTAQEWDIRYAKSEAVKGWAALEQQAPSNIAEAWRIMRTAPASDPSERHHRLKGELANGLHGGRQLPQWQLEVTGAGRIWYLLDTDNRTVWVQYASTGHPKRTE